jgi:hypothetical protein
MAPHPRPPHFTLPTPPSCCLIWQVRITDDGLSTRARIVVSTPSAERPAVRAGGVHVRTPNAVRFVRGGYELPFTGSRSGSTLDILFGIGQQAVHHVQKHGAAATTSTSTSAEVPAASATAPSVGCDDGSGADGAALLPDHAHVHMRLVGSPPLVGFEHGLPTPTVNECALACATQRSPDGWHKLKCQAWTFAPANVSGHGQAWCWLFAGRGNAQGTNACSFVSATCDNRPAPATDWPCCEHGFSCPDPIGE